MAETESGETTPPTDVAPEAIESAETADTGAETASREAARYRTRLREAEGVIAGMREEVDRLHRAEVERVAGTQPYWIGTPADVWAIGVELSELRDEAGRLDPERVKETLGAVLASHPNWSRRPDMGQGYRGGPPQSRDPSFADLLKRGRR